MKDSTNNLTNDEESDGFPIVAGLALCIIISIVFIASKIEAVFLFVKQKRKEK